MNRAIDTASFVVRTYRTLGALKAKSVTPRVAGERLARDACRMGPLYTKLAQFISARRDALDSDFIDALSLVQDSVEVPGDLQAPPAIPGYVIESAPLASASVADVFRGRRVRDGLHVVVKRRRAGVKEQVAADFPLLMAIMLAASIARVPGARNMYELIKESRSMVLGELDFKKEAASAIEFRAAFKDVGWLVVPRIVRVAEDMLVSEYVPSHKLSRVLPNSALAHRLMDLYMLMLEGGIVHADPHPGNLGFLSGGRVVLYDFGATLRVDVNVGNAMARLLQAGITKNSEGLISALEDIGVMQVQPGRRTSVRRVVRRVFTGNVHEELQKAPEFTDSEKRVVTFGTTFIYLARTLTLIDATCRTLDPEFRYDYARWVSRSSGGMMDMVRDVTSIPSTVITMQSDMEEFQVRIFEEIEAGKKSALILGVVSVAGIIFLADKIIW